ncbi:hypothetical protein Tco_0570012 [Tanacetum coccineum]
MFFTHDLNKGKAIVDTEPAAVVETNVNDFTHDESSSLPELASDVNKVVEIIFIDLAAKLNCAVRRLGGVEKNSLLGSEGIQCPTTDSSRNCVIGAEPGMAVSGHPPSPVREALFNTLRKDVHRGQKDSVIGT